MANRPDLEQSAFVQDLIRLGNWTINAGLRWDHYQLLLNRQAVDPRFSISRYFPSAESRAAFFLRQSLPDAVVREHPAFEFDGSYERLTRSLSNYPSSLPKETTTKWV